MEIELAQQSLNKDEEEILQIQVDPRTGEILDFQLVGCFLSASIIHYPTMKSTIANLLHPVRGAQILDLGEKRYPFQFFHRMDMEEVSKGSPLTFNNHLFILHELKKGRIPFTSH
ncbi:hypothetical protein J1N35_010431 [Gossypium stocksii]|uniref:DUF4283 domain-containing protein n=1 Tax=Gossypium stocksii TaxID=47602 RepID=A0A9D4ACA5_9ROSI|nr:hypothetical protein J1N35_010431 [Gossypium stocksii]